MRERRHTHDFVRAALERIDPNCSREEWWPILAGVKAELGDEGRAIAEEWSARAPNYNRTDFQSTWTSLTSEGGTSFGTVVARAKAGGFDPRAWPARKHAPSPSHTNKSQAKHEDALRAKKHDEAARRAQVMLDAAGIAGRASYLERKGVKAHGVRFGDDGALLVPMRTIDGALRSLQEIDAAGTKRYLPGGQKVDLLHMLGTPQERGAIGIAEGYATAASVHEATGLPVACAFDCANLPRVAHALRARYPEARLVICADNDHETEARSGRNPGLAAGREAARVGNAVLVRPEGLHQGESDFNDLAQRSGLSAVAAAINAAIAGAASPAHNADASHPDDAFELTDHALCFRARDRDGRESSQFVCGRLEVLALTRDGDAASWGYLVRFRDPDGTEKTIAIPARITVGDGNELRAWLADQGLPIAAGPAKLRLTHYLATRRPAERRWCVDAIGWHGDGFVLPDKSYGPGASELFYQVGDERVRNPFKRSGSLDGWRAGIAARCVGNPRLAFVVSLAFAGPLVHLLEYLGGGFHFFGASSKGKTTLLIALASVWGKPELGAYIKTWRATSNGLEAIAAAHSDTVLCLDEMRECDPREIVPSSMMLGNGQGKGRSRAGGGLRAQLTWRLLFGSTGERTIAELAALAGMNVDAGAGVRLVEIPIPESGAFDSLHDADNGAVFAERLRSAALQDYGVAGDAWLEYLTGHREEAKSFARECIADLLEDMLLKSTDAGQTQRVAARFALVGAAGALATRAGLTNWPVGEAERAAKALFKDWLRARGTRGDVEELNALRQVASVLSDHAESYFPWWHRGADDRRPNAPKRWGLRKAIDTHGNEFDSRNDRDAAYGDGAITSGQGETIVGRYYVTVTAFREHLCRGFQPSFVARMLHKRGYLIPESDKRLDRNERLPGIGPARCYVVLPSLFSDADL